MNDVRHCALCPRKCGADRRNGIGYCGAGDDIEVSKIMLHLWEEPPVSGYGTPEEREKSGRGSGAVFFTHCPLGCVYCQNSKISRTSSKGIAYTPTALADEMLKLEERGAYNINLVSPTQYTDKLIEAVKIARSGGLTLPIVWNTGGYELPETIRALSGTVDVYLTDLKYHSSALSSLLSSAPDYTPTALGALAEMYSSVGKAALDSEGMIKKGVIVRHLVLPSHRDDSIAVLRDIANTVPADGILLSLMAQYTPDFLPPPDGSDEFKSIRRKITTFEYGTVCDEARRIGFDGFMQDRSSATSRFTPDF